MCYHLLLIYLPCDLNKWYHIFEKKIHASHVYTSLNRWYHLFIKIFFCLFGKVISLIQFGNILETINTKRATHSSMTCTYNNITKRFFFQILEICHNCLAVVFNTLYQFSILNIKTSFELSFFPFILNWLGK